MSKESLFDMESSAYGVIPVGPARARHTDAETSHEAARKVDASGTAECHRSQILQVLIDSPGTTAWEIQRELQHLTREGISKRLPELERQGLVRRGAIRFCTYKTDQRMLTWWPTEKRDGG